MAKDDQVLFIYTTWPSRAEAEVCARAVVSAGLAACVNLLEGATSVYRWEGAVEAAAEVVALYKTTRGAAAALEALVRREHPYELPCFVALAVDETASNAAFLRWIRAGAAGA